MPVIRQHTTRRTLWCLGLCAVLMGVGAPPAHGETAIGVPTAQQVIGRVLAVARSMDVSRADVKIAFRFGEPVTAPPICVFDGTLHIGARLTLAMERWTPSPACWLIERLVLQRLFSDRDRADALLPQYHFDVLGEKLVGGRHYYLVDGRALARGTEPESVIGWVDYDRGVIADATARYRWGEVNSVQEYQLVAGQWVPVHQYITVSRLHASLEIFYSGFR
jgi:hypothetical protein